MREKRSPGLAVGLALGSGVARGWAHIGVLNALTRAGIRPDLVCGTSIGALIGGVYLAGALDALEARARALNKLRLTRLFDFRLGRSGLIAGKRLLQLFDEDFRRLSIEELPAPFACVATDLESGHEVWLQKGNLMEAVRASYALPGVFPPVRIDGRWLLDGALVNPIPVSLCRALGARIVIAVNLNADGFGAVKRRTARALEVADEREIVQRMRNLPGAELARHLLLQRSDEPSIISVMARSLQIMQGRISRSRLAGDPPDVTITPRLGGIGFLQFDRAEESIQAGEEAAARALPAIEEALERYGPGG